MKSIFELILIIFMLFTNIACNKTGDANTSPNDTDGTSQIENVQDSESVSENDISAETEQNGDEENNMININITVGDSVFSAKLYDNQASKTLLALFPLTLDMSDLNGNEKYCYLAGNLPSESSESPATINNGDIMCWSGNCLVLFYETFPNSYGGYVRLGYIENVSGFAGALGNGNVKVVFSVGD